MCMYKRSLLVVFCLLGVLLLFPPVLNAQHWNSEKADKAKKEFDDMAETGFYNPSEAMKPLDELAKLWEEIYVIEERNKDLKNKDLEELEEEREKVTDAWDKLFYESKKMIPLIEKLEKDAEEDPKKREEIEDKYDKMREENKKNINFVIFNCNSRIYSNLYTIRVWRA